MVGYFPLLYVFDTLVVGDIVGLCVSVGWGRKSLGCGEEDMRVGQETSITQITKGKERKGAKYVIRYPINSTISHQLRPREKREESKQTGIMRTRDGNKGNDITGGR